jgi:hypothetical protein
MKNIKNLINKIHIVISRYNEDLSWIEEYDFNFIIFNKGNNIEGVENIKLPNVGREAHTYLYYIINNYNNLPEYVCFLQGNPFDHSPNLIRNIIQFNDTVCEFEFLSENICNCDVNGYPSHPGLPISKFCDYCNIKTGPILKFGAGAQFVVSRNKILKRDINFYKKIITTVDSDIRPTGAYIMERLWGEIFK